MLSKLAGLRKLSESGLPFPNWRFTRNGTDLPEEPWADAPDGWSVRSCSESVSPFAQPSGHYLTYSAARTFISEHSRHVLEPVFVIYPSWRFIASGGCLVENERLTIEIMAGPPADLLRGRRSPDATATFDGWHYERMSLSPGLEEIIDRGTILQIRAQCLRIVVHRFVALEWSLTSRRKLYFHDWAED